MTRPVRAWLDASALRHNFERVRALAPQSKVMAIIKANGYGHGLSWVANTLDQADAYGVASVEEGGQLRAAGITKTICLLEGFFKTDELPLIGKHKLGIAVHHELQLAMLEQSRDLKAVEVWLKVDTGMHRLGFSPEAVAAAAARLKALPAVQKLRLMSHFANADNKFDATTRYQIELFQRLAETLTVERSLANSAGVMSWPASHMEWVRPGIMLYGATPVIGGNAVSLDLKPVMTLESELIAVQRRRKGEAIGYGGDYLCPEDMPVGVAAIGYGDGYPRHAPAGTPVLVKGRRAALVGRVSMDMITIDLRGLGETRVGDPVTLWGEGLPVDEVAQRAGTIGYELMCRVMPRVPRLERKPK